MKTKIDTEVAHVTRDSDATFKVKRSKSPGRFTQRGLNAQGRRLQRSAWERIRRGKVLLRCVCKAAHEALGRPRGRRGAGAYCVATRTACYKSCCTVDATKYYFTKYRIVNVWNSLLNCVVTAPILSSFRRQLAKIDLSKFCVSF